MKRRQKSKSYETKTMSTLNSRTVSSRNAHLISRCPVGTGLLSLTSGGAISALGGFSPSGSSAVFEIIPINLGWVADLAGHFAYWKLHRMTLVYTPTYRAVTDSAALLSAGTAAFGFADDPANIVGSAVATIQELRSGGEFSLGSAWSLSYKPSGPQADWLYTTTVGSSQTGSNMRLASAGQLIAASSVAASGLFYSATSHGRLELIFDVSFKGAVPFRVPSLVQDGGGEQKSQSEERKAQPASTDALRATAKAKALSLDSGDYELVEVVRSVRR